MNATADRTLFDLLDPPLWLLTAQAGGRRGGLIATFVNEASIVPDLPRVLVGLAQPREFLSADGNPPRVTGHTWELV